MRVLIIGSGPNAVDAQGWDGFDAVVAINNAWRIRPDWTHHIHPEDFPTDRRPPHVDAGQSIVTYRDYVPIQNDFGGFVYAGGTMAFTAGYWVLGHLRPRLIAYIGCDMTYAATGATHFYGTGTADPLRDDVTLRDLTAKSARLMVTGAERGCAMANLSRADQSRLILPRAAPHDTPAPRPFDARAVAQARDLERALNYTTPDGRYWRDTGHIDTGALDRLDALWMRAASAGLSPNGQG